MQENCGNKSAVVLLLPVRTQNCTGTTTQPIWNKEKGYPSQKVFMEEECAFQTSNEANGILPVLENELSMGKFQNISSAASRVFAYPTIKQCHGETHRDAESAVDELLATVQQMLEHLQLNTSK